MPSTVREERSIKFYSNGGLIGTVAFNGDTQLINVPAGNVTVPFETLREWIRESSMWRNGIRSMVENPTQSDLLQEMKVDKDLGKNEVKLSAKCGTYDYTAKWKKSDGKVKVESASNGSMRLADYDFLLRCFDLFINTVYKFD